MTGESSAYNLKEMDTGFDLSPRTCFVDLAGLLNSAGITGCVPPFLVRLKFLKVICLIRLELLFYVLSAKSRGS